MEKKLTAQSPETKSPDLAAENLAKLTALFPEGRHRGQRECGCPLKQLIGKTATDAEEKYGLNWHVASARPATWHSRLSGSPLSEVLDHVQTNNEECCLEEVIP